MNTTKNEQDIQSDVFIPDNFTMLPNMAIQELDATSFKLLAIYINTARQNSKCWKANQTVADELGCGIAKMKRAREMLDEMQYISFVPGTSTTRAIVTIRYADMWKRNSEYRGGGIQNEYPTGVSEMDTNKDSLKATKTKDSLSQKSAKDVAPSDAISGTKKKGEGQRIIERSGKLPKLTAQMDKWAEEIDWQAKILALLTDDWIGASKFENLLGIPQTTTEPLEFSHHPASLALYRLESERKVEYKPNSGNVSRRQWRLHPDGQPAPKSGYALLYLAIKRCLPVSHGAQRDMTHMLRGTAKKGVYGEEAEFFADNPVSADELENFVDYWVERNPDINKPSKPKTVSSEMGVYRLYMADRNSVPEINFDVHDDVIKDSMEARQAKHFKLFMQAQDGSEDE